MRKGLYPIGKLDKDSRGALLVSNNGLIFLKFSHPKYKTWKIIWCLDLWFTNQWLNKQMEEWCICEWIINKTSYCWHFEKRTRKTLLKIVLSEGRNRKIRRVVADLGHKVIDLKRIAMATIKLGSLKEGSLREIDISEWQNLLK